MHIISRCAYHLYGRWKGLLAGRCPAAPLSPDDLKIERDLLGSNKTWALRLHIPNHPRQLQLDTFNTLQSLNDLASINLDFLLKKYTYVRYRARARATANGARERERVDSSARAARARPGRARVSRRVGILFSREARRSARATREDASRCATRRRPRGGRRERERETRANVEVDIPNRRCE